MTIDLTDVDLQGDAADDQLHAALGTATSRAARSDSGCRQVTFCGGLHGSFRRTRGEPGERDAIYP